jgi:hypothetical protein
MTFTGSIIMYVNKVRLVCICEEILGKKFGRQAKEISKTSIDFKEVYKWIVSPIIVRELNVRANLEGSFLIHFMFMIKEEYLHNPLNDL